MLNIADDPIVACMMWTGFPPWMDADWNPEEDEEEEEK